MLEKNYEEYLKGFTDIATGKAYRGYADIVKELKAQFPQPDEIATETDKKTFVKLFGEFLTVKNILQNYDEFINLKEFQKIDKKDPDAVKAFKDSHFLTDEAVAAMQEIEVLTERAEQDYLSTYNDIRDWYREEREGKAPEESNIDWDDVVFEIDLLKSQKINLDYILELVFERNKQSKDKNALISEVRKIIRSSVGNRAKEGLIVDFIHETDLSAIPDAATILEAFYTYALERQRVEVKNLILEEELNAEQAERYIQISLARGFASMNGTDLDATLPRMSPLNPRYLEKNMAFTER